MQALLQERRGASQPALRATDALGRASGSAYDVAGRLTTATDTNPDGSEIRHRSFGYDNAGQATSATDPLGWVTTMAYDALGRLSNVAEPIQRGRPSGSRLSERQNRT